MRNLEAERPGVLGRRRSPVDARHPGEVGLVQGRPQRGDSVLVEPRAFLPLGAAAQVLVASVGPDPPARLLALLFT